jgi:hypothetical protein
MLDKTLKKKRCTYFEWFGISVEYDIETLLFGIEDKENNVRDNVTGNVKIFNGGFIRKTDYCMEIYAKK